MDQVKQVAGTYHLPANGFTAPEGYKFAGWKIGTDETIRAVGYAYAVSSNVTITAQWEALPPSAPEKSIWLGRNDIWSKVADLVDNPSAEGELMALNVELQAGDEFVVRVLGDTYLKYISGGTKDNFTFDGESNIVVKAGMGATYNFYVYDSLTKLSIERVVTTTGIEATYNQNYVFVGDTVTTRGSVTIKYVRDDASKVEISSEDYNNVKYYSNEACTELVDVEYVFTEADRGNVTVYAKLVDYKTSFSFEVIYKNYVLHQVGSEWVETPLSEDIFEHKAAIIHLEEGAKFAVRTLGIWTSGLEGDYYPSGAYTQEGDLSRSHFSSIWQGTADATKVTGVEGDVAWLTTVTGDYVIGVHEDEESRGVIVYRTSWTVTLVKASDPDNPIVLTPDKTLISEYQFFRLELHEGDVLTLQRGDVKYGFDYYYSGSELYLKFSKGGATEYFAGYDGTNSFKVKEGCGGVYSFYLKPQMIYYSIPSYPNSRTYTAEVYIAKEDLWYYTKDTAEPVEMGYDPYDSSNSVILANIALEEGDTIGFGNAILTKIGYTNIANAEQQAHFTAGADNKLVVKEGHAGAYTFHIVRSTGAITVDYTSVENQGGFEKGTYYIVGSADFSSGTSATGESWGDVAKALAMTLDNTGKPENYDNQYKATVKFNQDDEWKIRTNVYWPYIVENAGALEDNVYMQIVNSNIKVNRTGTYDIYLKTNNDGYWSLYISKAIDFTPDKTSVSIAAGESADVYVSYATDAEFETLTAVPDDAEVATATVNKALKKVTIQGVASGSTTVTISDGKTNVVIDVTVYNTYKVTFEMDLDEVRSKHTASNCSLYVFGTNDYVPQTWEQCAGNVESESVTFTIQQGKDITGVVFYFVEDTVTKQSIDIEVNINAPGTYLVNFVDTWSEVTTGVWKLIDITITPKALAVNKDAVTVEQGGEDTSVIASHWMGPLTVSSNHTSIATASINSETGVVTINGVSLGDAVITIGDGVTTQTVDVSVISPIVKHDITFRVVTPTSQDRVAVVGEFTNWATNPIELENTPGTNYWSKTVSLEEGKCEFKFVTLDDKDVIHWGDIDGDNRSITVSADGPTEVYFYGYEGLYLVGSMNSWTPSAQYKFTFNETGVGTLSLTGVVANAEFKLKADNDWITNSQAINWDNSGIQVLDGGNIKILAAGNYTVYFYPTNSAYPIGLSNGSSVQPGGTINRYLRGTMSEVDWSVDSNYQFSMTDNNIGELIGVQINQYETFKLADDDWKNEINYTGLAGGAKDNFMNGGDGGNIKCQEGCGGKYNFFIGSDGKLYVESYKE